MEVWVEQMPLREQSRLDVHLKMELEVELVDKEDEATAHRRVRSEVKRARVFMLRYCLTDLGTSIEMDAGSI